MFDGAVSICTEEKHEKKTHRKCFATNQYFDTSEAIAAVLIELMTSYKISLTIDGVCFFI